MNRLRLLADASTMLASTFEAREALARLARMLVPAIADWCTIAVREEDDVVRRIAGHHADPARAAVMARYLEAFPPAQHRSSAMTEAIANGRTFFAPHLTRAQLEAGVQDPAHAELLDALGCTGVVIVPLLARGESIGALSLAMASEARVLDDDVHQLARELGALAGLAVENARRFAAEHAARERAERAEADSRALLAERAELLRAAEASSRAKDEFLAILGHELRNPLAPIVTAIELMKARGTAPVRELGVIERQTRHLVRLVDDLLDVSRIARGRVELRREPLELRDVVRRAIEIAEPLVEKYSHRLSVDVPRGLVVEADPVRLAQVVANLLTNAATYTPPRGEIHVVARAAPGGVALRVRDNGVGISPEMLPHVFEMFAQERQPLDRSRGGLGLGLTIVKSLVEAHGGKVAASSAGVGRGSELEILLPACTRAPAAAPPAAAAEPARPACGMSVLVVDDNEDVAALMAESLARSGFVTRVAHDASEALAVVREFAPAAGILDIGLPVVDGYELARRLRAQPGLERMYLIAVTGYSQAEDRARALAAGFDHHLVKPVSGQAIRSLLDTALAASSGIPART